MRHWCSDYVGKPWAPDGVGPDRFFCWGLVRYVFLKHEGVDMPLVRVHEGNPDVQNVAAIKAAARNSGMRPLGGRARPAHMDIVVMSSPGTLHVGVVVQIGRQLRVLHASHAAGVVCEPWRDATAGVSIELWRRTK